MQVGRAAYGTDCRAPPGVTPERKRVDYLNVTGLKRRLQPAFVMLVRNW